MVRLSGKSMLYLPHEYAPCSLILPTCIRATAQHLAQNVATRGLFRVSGSAKVTSALFDYYCTMENGGRDVSSTVRSATLPLHIQFSVHDVASAFKRLLSVLPGGVLGSLSLFDAFVAIHSHLNGQPEYPRTKQTKVRARLMALAIGTIKSQFRRELICAVFGLLSLIGRIAEVSPREDSEGRPLPTSDLMGYTALGIVFGPLLVGDLLDQYSMKIATPNSGMLLFPLSPPRLRKERRKTQSFDGKAAGALSVDKVFMANSITEMLISNWRDIVRQMKSLGTCYRKETSTLDFSSLKSNAMDSAKSKHSVGPRTSKTRDTAMAIEADASCPETPRTSAKKPRLGILRRAASHRLLHRMSLATLSPTKEESISSDDEGEEDESKMDTAGNKPQSSETCVSAKQDQGSSSRFDEPSEYNRASKDFFNGEQVTESVGTSCLGNKPVEDTGGSGVKKTTARPNQVYLENVPPRESSRRVHSRETSNQCHSKEVSQESCSGDILRNHKKLLGVSLLLNDATAEPVEVKNCPHCNDLLQESSASSSNGKPTPSSTPNVANTIRLVEPSVINLHTSPPYQKTEDQNDELRPRTNINAHTYSDKSTQCEDVGRIMRRSSINTTPERFYKESPSSRDKSDEQESSPKAFSSLNRDVQVTVLSPTHSSESRALSKRSSVKATAALFESQRQPADEPESMNNMKDRSRERTSGSESFIAKITADSSPDKFQANVNDDQGQMMERPNTHRRIHSSTEYLAVDKSRLASQEDSPLGHSIAGVPNLGTMTPYREQPPIAQHLNFVRPTSSHSAAREGDAASTADIITMPCPGRPRSATVLYSQIRKLQRQLTAKTDEAVQLQRQLEAQTDSDIGKMGEQLREAKREKSMWRERAETAEKRVQVFEQFTLKLREIRDVITTDIQSAEAIQGERGQNSDSGLGNRSVNNFVPYNMPGLAARETPSKYGSADSPSSAAARLRVCLNSAPPAQDGAADDHYTDIEYTVGSCECEASRMRKTSDQILAAAEELLLMSDGGEEEQAPWKL